MRTNCSNASCETHCSPRTRTKKTKRVERKGGKVRRNAGVQHASARGKELCIRRRPFCVPVLPVFVC
ncbi:hypothetical protein CEXT_219171 [Caerostris extrusa]|uniref:Uncharacterized protein n=1 Tax=Caerostris extrusa TaxID=172846 RepID=A0AAV4XMF3_CAEEX|nr:hypothetical protein CEXT_219171 [Caerostris extrusa]